MQRGQGTPSPLAIFNHANGGGVTNPRYNQVLSLLGVSHIIWNKHKTHNMEQSLCYTDSITVKEMYRTVNSQRRSHVYLTEKVLYDKNGNAENKCRHTSYN